MPKRPREDETSTLSVAGEGAQQKNEAQQKKNAADQAALDRAQLAFAEYMRSRSGIAPIWRWARDIDEKGRPNDMPAIQSEISGLMEDGIYVSNTKDSKGNLLNWEFRVEGGKVTPDFTPKNDEEFKACYSEMMDVLSLGKGYRVIDIDWPDQKFVTEKKLKILLDLAAEKGLEVRLGPNVTNFLNSKQKQLSDESTFKRWLKETFPIDPRTGRAWEISDDARRLRRDEILKKSEYAAAVSRHLVADDAFKIHQEKFNLKKNKELIEEEKGFGVADKEEFNKKWTATDDNTKKLEAVQQELESTNKRIEKLNEQYSKLENQGKNILGQVESAQTERELQKPVSRFNSNKDEREAMLATLEKERKTLEDRANYFGPKVEALQGQTPEQAKTVASLNTSIGKKLQEIKEKKQTADNIYQTEIPTKINEKTQPKVGPNGPKV